MSNPIESNATPTGEFQAQFGAPPGTQDAAAECKKWEKLGTEWMEERKRLLAELAKTQAERDSYIKVVTHFISKDYVCPYTDEELLACVGIEPPIDDLIAELKRDLGT